MKVFLRNTKTSHYYVGNNQWTPDSEYARAFEQVEEAIQVYREEQLTGVEVVLSYEDPLCTLVLPLPAPG